MLFSTQGILFSKEYQLKTVQIVILLIIFTSFTPIGTGIGWAVLSSSPGLAGVILNSFAAGTLLYIGALEIPENEFSADKDPIRLCKFLMYCGGFLLMMVVDVIVKNSVGHGH